jgi:hypothetical protein
VALGQVFSDYFGFPCQYSFHQFLHNHHHLSSGTGTIGQNWPQYPKSHRTNLIFKIALSRDSLILTVTLVFVPVVGCYDPCMVELLSQEIKYLETKHRCFSYVITQYNSFWSSVYPQQLHEHPLYNIKFGVRFVVISKRIIG